TTDRLSRRRDFSYDHLNRLTTEVWVSSGVTVNTLTHVYDAASQETMAADGNGTYNLGYDALGRTTSVQGPFSTTLTYTYDAASNRTKVQDSFGGVTTLVYDVDNERTSLQYAGQGATLREDRTYTARGELDTTKRYSDLAGSTKVGE